jgi:hypothetical protein
VAPRAPDIPARPAGPCVPAWPIAPVAPRPPSNPGSPAGPARPVAPRAPAGPPGPTAPGAPGGPAGPASPGLPGLPWGPLPPQLIRISPRMHAVSAATMRTSPVLVRRHASILPSPRVAAPAATATPTRLNASAAAAARVRRFTRFNLLDSWVVRGCRRASRGESCPKRTPDRCMRRCGTIGTQSARIAPLRYVGQRNLEPSGAPDYPVRRAPPKRRPSTDRETYSC